MAYTPGGSSRSSLTDLLPKRAPQKKKQQSQPHGLFGTGVGPNVGLNDIVKGFEGVGKDFVGLGSLIGNEVIDFGGGIGLAARGDLAGSRQRFQSSLDRLEEVGKGFGSSLAGTAADVADLAGSPVTVPVNQASKLLGGKSVLTPGKWVREAYTEAEKPVIRAVTDYSEKKVEQRAKELAPRPFGERVKERGFLSPILEDVGNVALVASAGAGAAKAVGAPEGVINALETAKHPLRGAYDATVRPFTKAAAEARTGPMPEGEPGAVQEPIPSPRAEQVAAANEKPVPAYAQAAVGKLNPEGKAVGALNWLEGKSQAHAVRTVAREQARVVEATRNEMLHDEAVQQSVQAARSLIEKQGIPHDQANLMVGDAIEGRITGEHQLFADTLAQYPELAPYLKQVGATVEPIPAENMTPELDTLLNHAAEGWKQLLAKNTEVLKSSRPGEKGLQGQDTPLLTTSQVRRLRGAQKALQKAAKLMVRSEREREVYQGNIEQLTDKSAKLALEAKKAIADGRVAADKFDRTRAIVPKGFRNDQGWAARVQEIVDGTAQNEGHTYSPYEDRHLVPIAFGGKDAGWAVSLLPETIMSVPAADWATHGPAALDFVAKGYQDLLTNPAYNIGTWLDDKTGLIHIDISQNTMDGVTPITRDQAITLGLARAQKSVFDFTTGQTVDMAGIGDPNTAARFADRHGFRDLRAGQLRKLVDEVNPKTGEKVRPNLTHEDIDNWMAVQDKLAVAASEADPARFKHPDEVYRHFQYQGGRRPNMLPKEALAQTFLMKEPDMRLWKEVQNNVGDLDKSMRWYDESHNAIEKRWRGKQVTLLNGKRVDAADLIYDLVAVTSVAAGPLDNLRNGLTGFANLQDFFTHHKMALQEAERLTKEMLDIDPKRASSRAPSPRLTDSFMKNLTEGTHLYDNPKYAVAEILSGKTLDEWTPDYIQERALQWGGAEKKLSMKNVPPEAVERLGEPQAWMEHHGSRAFAKILSFRDNLANPATSTAVTLDSWMARLFGIKDWMSSGAYLEYADKLRSLADEVSAEAGRTVRPHEVQAALWTYAKQEISRQNVGVFMAHVQDSLDAIEAGTWTPESDPIGAYYDERFRPIEEAQGRLERNTNRRLSRKMGATKAETAQELGATEPGVFSVETKEVPTVRGVNTVEETKGAPRQIEWQSSALTKGLPKEVAAAEQSWAEYRTFQDEIHAAMKAGDPALAERKLSEWANQRAARLRDENFGSFADVLDRPGGSLPGVLDRLKEQGPELLQSFRETVKGAFLEKDQRYIIKLFQDADFTTLVHENGHMLRRLLPADQLQAIERSYGVKGTWTRSFEERFADDFTTYLNTAEAPKGLEGAFARTRNVLAEVWAHLSRRFAGGRITPEVADVFDGWLKPASVTPLDAVPGTGGAVRLAPGTNTPLLPETTGTLAQRLQQPTQGLSGPAEGYRQGVRAAKSVQDLEDARVKANERMATKARVDKSLAEMKKTLAENSLPSAVEAAALDARATRTLDRLGQQLDNAPWSRWPREWAPLGRAVQELGKIAENDPELAGMLEEIPQNFSGVVKRATELGFNPAHVRDFTPAQVRRLMYDTIRLGKPGREGMEIQAGTRRQYRGILAKQGTVARSIEALAASIVEVHHELRSNQLVDFIEGNIARPFKAGERLPDGWVEWDPMRRLLKGDETAGPGTKYVVPKAVETTLRRMHQDYSHGIFRTLSRVTSPWRALVLTLSPRWYVNNFLGNAALATLEGVRLKDWKAAWDSYRKRDLEGRFADVPAIRRHSFVSDIGEPSIVPTEGLGEAWKSGDSVPEKVGAVRRQVGFKLRRANEVVDEIARAAVYKKTLRTTGSDLLALNKAYSALVDYADLSPFEQQVVRSIVPFYAWQKGVLKIVSRMPVDHPVALGVAMRMGSVQRQLLNDRVGTELPFGYAGLSMLPGGGGVNTRGFNPFADSLSLTTPDGIAGSINPFLDLGIRKALGAPEGGFVQSHRMSPYGTAIPDVNEGPGLIDILTGVPGVQLGQSVAGSGNYGVGQQALKFAGINYMTPEDVQKVKERVQAARAQIKANAPYPARKKKSKSAPVTSYRPL